MNMPPTPTYTIDKIKTQHVTNGYALVPTDFDKLNRIVMSGYEPERCRKEACDAVLEPYVPLRRIMQKFTEQEMDGHLQVSYKRKSVDTSASQARADDHDRAYADRCISAGSMKREVRAAMYHGTLVDFDQCSSHQSLILSALKADPEEPCHEWIERYVKNKKHERQRIADTFFNGDMAKSKLLFQCITFGGKTTIRDPLVQGLVTEFESFTESVVRNNPRCVPVIKRRVKNKNAAEIKKAIESLGISEELASQKYGNKDWRASLMSLWCRNKESMVIEAVLGWAISVNLVQNRRFDNSFDGLMIPVDDVDHFLKTDTVHSTMKQLLRQFNKVGTQETGYNVKWEVKDMQPEHDLFWKEYEEFEEKERLECPNYFDREVLCNMTSTQQRFDYFNKHFHYVEDQHKVLHFQRIYFRRPDGSVIDERNILWANFRELMSTFGHLPSGHLNDKGVDVPIAKLWFDSRVRSQYGKVDAFPYAGVFDSAISNRVGCPHILNTFMGYPPDVWEDASDTEMPEEVMYNRLGPFFQLSSHLAGLACYDKQTGLFPKRVEQYPVNDRIQLELMLYFFGIRVAFPEQNRLPYYLCIQSECGTGKNTLLEPLRRLVGSNHYKCSSDMEAFCGAHSEGLISKIFAVLNEADISSTAKVTNRFKEFVTEEHQTSNVKFMRPFEYAVWAAIVVLTNSKIPMRIEPMNRERRIILFKSNNWTAKHWGNDMWSGLHKHFNSLPFLRALRQYFTTRNYKSFDFRKARAANLRRPAYTQLALHFTPVEVMFVRHYIEAGLFSTDSSSEENPRFWEMSGWDALCSVRVKTFHEMARTFYSECNLTSAATERSVHAFTQKIEELVGVNKDVGSGRVNYFKMVPSVVYKDFIDKCLVDTDLVDEELVAAYEVHSEADHTLVQQFDTMTSIYEAE